MERKDLLAKNNAIFIEQGAALDKVAKKSVKVVVVGNPCNTNALTCMKNAPTIPSSNFSCLTRLDQNRAKAKVSKERGFYTFFFGYHFFRLKVILYISSPPLSNPLLN